MVYLDSSAGVKLVRLEDHSDALAAWLSGQDDPMLCCSVLLEVELPIFVAYDARLLAAARDDGFPVAKPGVVGT